MVPFCPFQFGVGGLGFRVEGLPEPGIIEGSHRKELGTQKGRLFRVKVGLELNLRQKVTLLIKGLRNLDYTPSRAGCFPPVKHEHQEVDANVQREVLLRIVQTAPRSFKP